MRLVTNMVSYYLSLLAKKTKLYPNGQKLTVQQRYAREAEKVDARKRRMLVQGE